MGTAARYNPGLEVVVVVAAPSFRGPKGLSSFSVFFFFRLVKPASCFFFSSSSSPPVQRKRRSDVLPELERYIGGVISTPGASDLDAFLTLLRFYQVTWGEKERQKLKTKKKIRFAGNLAIFIVCVCVCFFPLRFCPPRQTQA